MPIAYEVPLPERYRNEFDGMDLADTRQLVVACPLGCATRYALIYKPAETDEAALQRYQNHIHGSIGNCGHHPDKIVFNF